jgi:hypothetical protein
MPKRKLTKFRHEEQMLHVKFADQFPVLNHLQICDSALYSGRKREKN